MKKTLQKHEPDCMAHKPCRIMFPSPKVKKSDEESDEECEIIEEALNIDADIR